VCGDMPALKVLWLQVSGAFLWFTILYELDKNWFGLLNM